MTHDAILRNAETISDCFLVLTKMREAEGKVRARREARLLKAYEALRLDTLAQVRASLVSAVADLAPALQAVLWRLAEEAGDWKAEVAPGRLPHAPSWSCTACGRILAAPELDQCRLAESLAVCPSCLRVLIFPGQVLPESSAA